MKDAPGPGSARRPSARVRAAFGALCASTALLALVLVPSSAAAFAPIEGVWEVTSPPNSVLLIQETSPGHFQDRNIRGEAGCVVDEEGFVNKVGILDGELVGSGLEYGGFRSALSDETCEPTGQSYQALTKIISADPTDYRLRNCISSAEGEPVQVDSELRPTAPTTHCDEWVRIHPPEAPATFNRIVTVPPAPACTAATRRRGRLLKLKLRNPVNEPLLSAIVKLGSTVVLSYQYPATVPPLTKITLPAGRKALTIKVVTTSGKTFKRKRHYGACRPRKVHHRRRHR